MAGGDLSVWLLAREDQQQRLRDTVESLADRHLGHRFEPHVTLQGDLALAEPQARALVQALAGASPVLRWPVRAVEGTEHFFRALYLRLDAGVAFDALQHHCLAHTATNTGLSPYAHLSLAYGAARIDAAGSQAALSRDFVGEVLEFDRVALCRSSQAVPIAGWCLLQVLPLVGAPPASPAPAALV